MKLSKFYKVDSDILLEYIYDDSNLLSEQYGILNDIKNSTTSFISTNTSATFNRLSEQLFSLDKITSNYTNVDLVKYPFLQLKEYSEGIPVQYDTIKIHLPINYSFGDYQGFQIRAYSLDITNKKQFDLSNTYFDVANQSTQQYLEYNNPPLFFTDRLWGKSVSIQIPAISAISTQLKAGIATENSINYNLTGGVGLNQSTPIIIEFRYIQLKKTISGQTQYTLSSPNIITVPQTPEYKSLGVKIEHSGDGDYFDIYGTYNTTLAEFKTFIDNARYTGSNYYVEYSITTYEENLKQKSLVFVVTDNFNEKIEYRPIIKTSTTTAIIDVEMRLIDQVDGSQITRNASYGMLPTETSKYSRNLTKINLSNANKPKIYNVRDKYGFSNGGSILDQFNSNGFGGNSSNSMSNALSGIGNGVTIEQIKVPYTILMDKYNVVAKSDSVLVGKTSFFGEGKLCLMLKPFDNIVKIIIARDITSIQNQVNNKIQYTPAPQYLNLTNMGTINMVFKNTQQVVSFPLFTESSEVNLINGATVFKITQSKMNDIRKIFDTKVNVFYITATQNSTTSVLYSGLFKLYDSSSNISTLNTTSNAINNLLGKDSTPSIITDPNASDALRGTAIVTRKKINKPGSGGFSDIRLKRNVELEKVNAQGLNIYTFQYLNSDEWHLGVIAQEILNSPFKESVSVVDGYYYVDYSQIDVD
jgi:hypothetical protein